MKILRRTVGIHIVPSGLGSIHTFFSSASSISERHALSLPLPLVKFLHPFVLV